MASQYSIAIITVPPKSLIETYVAGSLVFVIVNIDRTEHTTIVALQTVTYNKCWKDSLKYYVHLFKSRHNHTEGYKHACSQEHKHSHTNAHTHKHACIQACTHISHKHTNTQEHIDTILPIMCLNKHS